MNTIKELKKRFRNVIISLGIGQLLVIAFAIMNFTSIGDYNIFTYIFGIVIIVCLVFAHINIKKYKNIDVSKIKE
jgi:heme/copper-type cytochrome/quinol oxidase subunit 4